jgi:hypothetical protein
MIALLALGSVALPGRAQVPDSTGFTKRPQVRFSAIRLAEKRGVSLEQAPVFKSGATSLGLDFSAVDDGGAGIQIRFLDGDFDGPTTALSAGQLRVLDARGTIGARPVNVIVGYTLREFAFEGERRRVQFPRAGLQVSYWFPGAAFEVGTSGTYGRSINEEKSDSTKVNSFEGETWLQYAPPRFPVFARLGYRRELFSLKQENTIRWREELGGILFGIGVQFGMDARTPRR